MDLSFEQIGVAVSGFITLAGGIIGVWMKANTNQALLKQENEFIMAEMSELKKRVQKLEDDLFQELKNINHSITDLRLLIQNKQDRQY